MWLKPPFNVRHALAGSSAQPKVFLSDHFDTWLVLLLTPRFSGKAVLAIHVPFLLDF